MPGLWRIRCRLGDGAGDQVEVGGVAGAPSELVLAVGVMAVGAGCNPWPVFGPQDIAGVGLHGGNLGVGAVMALETEAVDGVLVGYGVEGRQG